MTKKKLTTLIIFFICFYGIWAFFELVGKRLLDTCISNEILCQITKSWVIKNLVWTLPAALLIHFFSKEVYISLKEMFTTKVKWLKYLPVFLIFTVWIIVNVLLRDGKLQISDDFDVKDVIILVTVGLTEEMVFRGWLLNATIDKDHIWLPVFINSVMFVTIHFPVWIHDGLFISKFTSFGFMNVITLSVIFSWSFIKSRNIFVPILLHTYWDVLAFMFF